MFVLAKFIWTTHSSKKLLEKFLGPFKIIKKPSTYSYQVKLPAYLRSIHPIFYLLQLELPSLSSIKRHHNPPLLPIKVEGNIEYEIVQVLDLKLNC